MVRNCASAAGTRSRQLVASDASMRASGEESDAPASLAMGSPASGLDPRESVAASDAFSFPLVDEFPQAAGPNRAASDTSEDMAIVHPGDGKDLMLMADRGDATSVPRIALLTGRRMVANALRGRRVTVCQSRQLCLAGG